MIDALPACCVVSRHCLSLLSPLHFPFFPSYSFPSPFVLFSALSQLQTNTHHLALYIFVATLYDISNNSVQTGQFPPLASPPSSSSPSLACAFAYLKSQILCLLLKYLRQGRPLLNT